MKSKPKEIIEEDIELLLKFLSYYPQGKLHLCNKFHYNQTSSVDRWFERGFPTRMRDAVQGYIHQMIEKEIEHRKVTKAMHKRLSKVWA